MGWLNDVIGLDLAPRMRLSLASEVAHNPFALKLLEEKKSWRLRVWPQMALWRWHLDDRFASLWRVLRPLSTRPWPGIPFWPQSPDPFALKLLKLELKDSAYFPKRPLHHRWQGTNKASGIWVLLLTRSCTRSFCRSLMFLSDIFATFRSERFWDFLRISKKS